MAAEGSGTIRSRIRSLLRSPSAKLRRRSGAARCKQQLSDKVTLEKVLGITAPGNRALACNPRTGLLAYPAGCVVVLLNPRKNKQHHIFNVSRKTITTLAFSPDGKYVVTGESGHMPAVRVWDADERLQVSELQEHKYGIACVTFSPNSKYIVSVGFQHDMMVHVWSWKKNMVVAANKVSSKVTAVSFSDDSSYFVTAGNRHVKFWYLDHSKTSKVSATVPLLGRSGLLGELRNNFFTDVACGRSRQAASTFCITSSGLLCEFNDRRLLDKWVELRTSQATCLCVTDEFIFCGCSDGTVRAFSPINLHFLCTLPRPHHLGTDVGSMMDASQLFSCRPDARYPDTLAVTYDPTNRWLSCVYNDHSVYVWDIRDLCDPRKAGKLYSALYHSSCVWGLEVHSEGGGATGRKRDQVRLSSSCFLSCSSDNTIRLWNMDGHNVLSRNILSHDLQKVLYVDNNTVNLLDTDSINATCGNAEKAGPLSPEGQVDQRGGIRTLRLSPDGQHLASGDRMGVLRIHNLDSMEEILNVQAHDSEILCLEFSKPDTGLQLLATASRDRLIHVLDAANDYSLVQTLDEHSSSITAVRFAANESQVRMISCGADKSVYFRTAQQTDEGLQFTRTHHVVRKTTLYDMDVEPTRKYAAVGCQDRSIRIFNISNGKQKRMYKGSQGEDGTLIKVQIDPSGLYIATSCSDKNISIFDFYSGECVASMFGHSEIVTGMKFSSDCKHLITVSGDSCIFVWRLSPELTLRMKQRLADLRPPSSTKDQNDTKLHKQILRDMSSPHVVTMSSDSDREEGEEVTAGSQEETDMSDEKNKPVDCRKETQGRLPRRRWSRRMGSADDVLMVTSMLDLRLLDSYCPHEDWQGELEVKTRPLCVSTSPCSLRRRGQCVEASLHRTNQVLGSSISLQVEQLRTNQRPEFIPLSNESPEGDEPVLYPDQWEDRVSLAGSEFQVKEVCPAGGQEDKPSPDSACSLGFSSRRSSPERADTADDSEPTEPLSVYESELDEDEHVQRSQTVPQTPDQEEFLKEHFTTLDHHTASGGPSISSWFLSQNSAGSHPGPRLPSHPMGGVAEVRFGPLVDQNQVQVQSEYGTHQDHQDQTQAPEEQVSTQKMKIQMAVDSRRSPGHRSSCGLKKARSVHSLLSDAGDSNVHVTTRRSRDGSSQPLPLQRPTTLPSSPRRPLSTAPPLHKPCFASPRSPQQEPLPPAPKKSSAARTYMSPTASSMAKMSRSVSVGDGLNDPDDGTVVMSSSPGATNASSSEIGEAPPLSVAVVPSYIAPATPPHAAVLDVVIPSASISPSLTHHGNQPRGLQARVPGRSLPDKPSFASILPYVKPLPSATCPSSFRTPPTSVSPVTSPRQGAEPDAPGDDGSVEQRDDADQPISVDACRALTNELQSCFRRATHLYRKVSGSCPDDSAPEHSQVITLLSESFQAMRAELDGLLLGAPGTPGEGKMAALLEEYSLLLLQTVHRKLRLHSDA